MTKLLELKAHKLTDPMYRKKTWLHGVRRHNESHKTNQNQPKFAGPAAINYKPKNPSKTKPTIRYKAPNIEYSLFYFFYRMIKLLTRNRK